MQSTVVNNHVCEPCTDALHYEVLGTLDGSRLNEANTAEMIREYGPELMAHRCEYAWSRMLNYFRASVPIDEVCVCQAHL